MQKILIATHNQGKFKELMEVLSSLPFEFTSLADLNITQDVEETGETFEDNAILKAEFFGQLTSLPTIADDSGIHVDALDGELGVKTRRWGAGADASDQEWLNFFLNRMSTEKNRRAEFITVVAFYEPKKPTQTFRGECVGQLLDGPQVEIEIGIPLSSIFIPKGKDKVYSAMSEAEKNEISHRGRAITACASFLKSQA